MKVGQVVLFVLHAGVERPAIVLGAEGETLDLNVQVKPGDGFHELVSAWHFPAVAHSDAHEVGTWHLGE